MTSQASSILAVKVPLRNSMHYSLSLVNLYMSSMRLWESSWISILSRGLIYCLVDVNSMPKTVYSPICGKGLMTVTSSAIGKG